MTSPSTSPISSQQKALSPLGGAIAQIRALYPTVMPAEQRVADFVLQHPHETVHMSIADLAMNAKVSEGTVVRFCQTVGYKGYQSFKISLAADLALSVKIIHGEAERADDLLSGTEGLSVGH
jgi:DNA-binding MurR/RpiR family transcriptional regulator